MNDVNDDPSLVLSLLQEDGSVSSDEFHMPTQNIYSFSSEAEDLFGLMSWYQEFAFRKKFKSLTLLWLQYK